MNNQRITREEIIKLVKIQMIKHSVGVHADKIWLNPPVCDAVSKLARQLLGYPVESLVADDDEKYYALCESISRDVRRKISIERMELRRT